MLNINGTRPSNIIFNGNSIDGLKANKNGTTTGVWGKAMSLTVTPIEEAGISVERISSEYEGAATGSLSLSDTIYYGDRLKLTAGNFLENYEFDYFDVSGTRYLTNPCEVLCTTDLQITTHAVSTYTPEWRVVFSGTQDSPHNSSTTAATYTMTFNGLKVGVPTIITGSLMKETSTVVGSFVEQALPIEIMYNSVSQKILEITTANKLSVTLQRPTPTLTNKPPFFRITKIQQYY